MTQNTNSAFDIVNSSTNIEGLCFSVRTFNRLCKMGIDNLDQIARTTPKQFLAVEGFGKKCLYEIAQKLEQFFSSLSINHLRSYAGSVNLWRRYFPHPELVPMVAHDPDWMTPGKMAPIDDQAIKQTESFNPTHNLQAQMLVQDLPISARARNVVANAKLKTLNDLALATPDTLKKFENCGRKTIEELAVVLMEYFDSLSSSGHSFYSRTGPRWARCAKSAASDNKTTPPIFLIQDELHSVMEVIEEVMTRLDDRSSSILNRRMGLLRGQTRKTLEAIGREFHLTRERVRQIVDKALTLMLRSIKTRRPDVYRSVEKFIRTRHVVSIEEVMTSIPNFGSSGAYDERAGIRMLLIANPEGANQLDPVGNLWGAREITMEFSKKVLRTARTVLKGIPMQSDLVSVEVAKCLREFDDVKIKIIHKLLLNPFGQPRIGVSTDGTVLQPPKQSSPDRRRAFIYAYIKEQGVPVQIQEIFSELQDSAPDLIPDSPTRRSAINSISGNLDRDNRFAWAGMSTWGLREWGYVSLGNSVAAAVLEVLRASDIPLSTAQIRKDLSQLYRVSAAGVSTALKASEGKSVARNFEGLWSAI